VCLFAAAGQVSFFHFTDLRGNMDGAVMYTTIHTVVTAKLPRYSNFQVKFAVISLGWPRPMCVCNVYYNTTNTHLQHIEQSQQNSYILTFFTWASV